MKRIVVILLLLLGSILVLTSCKSKTIPIEDIDITGTWKFKHTSNNGESYSKTYTLEGTQSAGQVTQDGSILLQLCKYTRDHAKITLAWGYGRSGYSWIWRYIGYLKADFVIHGSYIKKRYVPFGKVASIEEGSFTAKKRKEID